MGVRPVWRPAILTKPTTITATADDSKPHGGKMTNAHPAIRCGLTTHTRRQVKQPAIKRS
jgi:hypothetical protein